MCCWRSYANSIVIVNHEVCSFNTGSSNPVVNLSRQALLPHCGLFLVVQIVLGCIVISLFLSSFFFFTAPWRSYVSWSIRITDNNFTARGSQCIPTHSQPHATTHTNDTDDSWAGWHCTTASVRITQYIFVFLQHPLCELRIFSSWGKRY